jgi:hypothetical protein
MANGDDIRHIKNLDPKLKEAIAQIADNASFSERNWIGNDLRAEMRDIQSQGGRTDGEAVQRDRAALSRHVMKVVSDSKDPQKFTTQLATITGLKEGEVGHYLAQLKNDYTVLETPSGEHRSGPEARQHRQQHQHAKENLQSVQHVLQAAISEHVSEAASPMKTPPAETRKSSQVLV